jgi:hypothetical protein
MTSKADETDDSSERKIERLIIQTTVLMMERTATHRGQRNLTTVDDLPVELFYEVFTYMQLHEILQSFSDLNQRIAAILSHMKLLRVFLGLNGMSMSLTHFYQSYLTQPNACDRLVSLCVSDEMSIGNGVWLAKHIHKFTMLRQLSLIDIKREPFESILDSLPSGLPLVMFTVDYSTYYRAAYTFEGVPEGTYYARIFGLFPTLRVGHLRFWRYMYEIMDTRWLLPEHLPFMPIDRMALQIQTVVLRQCSRAFLGHLLRHLPQLRRLSFTLDAPWLRELHPLTIEQADT